MPSNSKRSAAVPTGSSGQSPSTGTVKQTTTSTPASTTANASGTTSTMPPVEGVPGVNRKKQKRRQKQAARLAAEQQRSDSSIPMNRNGQNGSDGYDDGTRNAHSGNSTQHKPNERSESIDNPGAWYSDDDQNFPRSQPENHHHNNNSNNNNNNNDGSLNQSQSNTGKGKSKKKKGKKGRNGGQAAEGSSTSHSTPPPPPLTSSAHPVGVPPPLVSAYRSAHRISKDRIWNTSTHEERENIKEFWLQLGEEERRSLVKVEKEAVLRKMKEQQKHSCSCTVCGRKRTAIEEELEVLYDAYYEELEQYANNNQASFENGASLRLPPRLYQTPIRSLHHHHHHHHSHLPSAQHPSRGRVHELPDDDEDEELDEDYEDEDEEDEEPYSDEDLDVDARTTRADFFAFGNSLTVKDGILTVADDLLKNDGKHFIDMMEQLAERRMQREEETQYITSAAHPSMQPGHNHGAPLDDEDYEDDEDEEYDSQEEDEFEEDEMDAMTEEQRMEEGRRMFQIFAARMFEQRVLTAYREKVARERQQRLIEELEEENRLDEEREAKKAKEAQKKKDKKRLQKQAKDEERARREAERAAELAAQKAAEEAKLKEQQRKKEEQRKKKEAEKKAQEEERLRKEADRQRRLKEERERQAEAERKQREQKEKEKKKREEAKKKEREEREAREKEQRERKAREEREQKAKAEQEKRGKDAAAKADREHSRREEFGSAQPEQPLSAQNAKRASQPGVAYFPPGLHHPQPPNLLQSPHFQVATPVIPKAPTPVRARQASQQGSHASSPRSQPAYADTLQNSISPGAAHSSGASSVVSNKGMAPHTNNIHHPQPSTPMSPLGAPGRGQPPPGFNALPSLNGIPGAGVPGMGHRGSLSHESSMYPTQHNPIASQFRGIGSPEGLSVPPGIVPRHPTQGRGFGLEPSHAALPFHSSLMSGALGPQPIQIPRENLPHGHGHTGQLSTSIDRSHNEPLPLNQPIGSRPAPIQRPSSTVHDHGKERTKSSQSDIDDLSTQLGSSALLDDTDLPLSTGPSQPIPAPGAGRMAFGTTPLFSESLGSTATPNFPLGGPSGGSTWGSGIPFGPPGFPSATSWGASPSPTWPNNAFGVIGRPHHTHTPRPVTIRLLVSQACKKLSASSPESSGFHSTSQVLRQIEQLNPPLDVPISVEEIVDICDTEGNSQNGGGSLIVDYAGPRGTFIKFEPDSTSPLSSTMPNNSPGDIGSPVPRNSFPAHIGSGTSAGGSGGSNPRYFTSVNVPPPTGC